MKLKVMTYNIHFTIGTDNVPDWRRICELIKPHRVDLLGLEEVTVNHPRTPELNVPETISRELNMDCVFAQAITINNGKGKYGVAGLANCRNDGKSGKLEAVEKLFLPTPEGIEKRVVQIMRYTRQDFAKPIYFLVTHFSYQGEYPNDEAGRLASAEMITDTVYAKNYLPAIWVGDFNTYPGTVTIDYLHNSWDVANDADTVTPTAHCQNAGWRQIDFICTAPRGAFKRTDFKFIDDMLASDHRPALAEFEF